jgi:hypothetical protein
LPEPSKNYTVHTLIGSVSEILERKFREGKRLNQTYYILKVGPKDPTLNKGSGTDQLQAQQEDLKPNRWTQIKKMAILNQELVFKYRKFYQNKQLLDFLPSEKKTETESPLKAPNEMRGKATIGIELNKDSKR